jgi:pimeloyl-ACP methyl ester carboxylesterase
MPKLLLAAAASALILSAAANPSSSGPLSEAGSLRFAEVADHKVAYEVRGTGRPTIVLITGLGHSMKVFDGVAATLSRQATVITYDRPGYGKSGLIERPAEARAAADDLAGVLEQSGLPGPYIIVGHSFGGLVGEQFAALHPDKVSGLILEEARPATFGPVCEAAGLKACSPTPEMVRWSSAGTQHDVSGLASLSADVAAIRPAASLRVLVMSRAVARSPTPFETLWSQAQSQLARKYPGAVQLNAPSKSHDVHAASPDWFCAAIMTFAAGVER